MTKPQTHPVNLARPVLLLEWPDDVTRHSGDGGASLSEWYDDLERNRLFLEEINENERNRREDEKERIEKEWYENEHSRAATADADEEF